MSLSQIVAFSNEVTRRQLKRRAEMIENIAIAMHGKAEDRNKFIAELERLSGR